MKAEDMERKIDMREKVKDRWTYGREREIGREGDRERKRQRERYR